MDDPAKRKRERQQMIERKSKRKNGEEWVPGENPNLV